MDNMDMFVYESVSCVCLYLSDEPVLFLYICMKNCCICLHVWMAPGKISCELTGSPLLNKVFELNWSNVCILPNPLCISQSN